MRRLCLAVLFCLAAPGAIPAELEPGEWEFSSVSTSRLFPSPQRAIFRRCIRREEAQNPDRWMADPGQGDCKVTPGKKTPDTYTWTMECAGAKMRGTGSARLGRASMEGETLMTGEVQGQKFDLRTRVTGRRVGPCKG